MNPDFLILSRIIRERRAVFPQFFKPGKISKALLLNILENGIWAPTHKKTQPWRFIIIQDEKLVDLSKFLAEHYKSITPEESFSEQKMIKASEKPLQSACVIALCLNRSPEETIPAWEETAALSCATQNIWLSASALGIGAYWSTPSAIYKMNDFLKLQKNEECLGLFYMGWKKEIVLPAERWNLDKVIREL